MWLAKTIFLFLITSSCGASNLIAVRNSIIQNQLKFKLPAISVSIRHPNSKEIINFSHGFYSQESSRKINRFSIFQIGSITKTFTATIVMQLIERGVLRFDHKLKKFTNRYPRWGNFTVRDFLSHTTGIYNYTHSKKFDQLLLNNPHKIWTLYELADIAYTKDKRSHHSKGYFYSNTDYILLGIIIEKVTSKSLDTVFNTYLKKYKLNNSFYNLEHQPKSKIKRLVHGYNQDGTFKFNKDVTFVSNSFAQSSGGLFSTPTDIILWLDQLFSGEIISPSSLDAMLYPNSTPRHWQKQLISFSLPKGEVIKDVDHGLGIGLVYIKDSGYFWAHAGGMLGYESFFIYNPKNKLALCIMYNVKPQKQLVFAKIAYDILKTFKWSK
jgi:D-alanyl-D-alanine carboxypeptidase